jgi:hypothetical protein
VTSPKVDDFLVLKDPDAVLDYGFDWTAQGWLPTGDTITASAWTVPSGLTEVTSVHDDTTTTVWLAGGVEGVTYPVVNHITTSGGRQDDRTLMIRVLER